MYVGPDGLRFRVLRRSDGFEDGTRGADSGPTLVRPLLPLSHPCPSESESLILTSSKGLP